MKITNNNHHHSLFRKLVLFGFIGILAAPSVGSATTPGADLPAPIAATDTPCEPTVVALEVDVATGSVYLVDASGGLTLTDNEINVYFGSQTSVLVDIEYSSDEWEVEITPTGGPTDVLQTRGGALRYWISDQPEEYLFKSTALSGMSTMMDMTPIVPDVVVRPKKDCPPTP